MKLCNWCAVSNYPCSVEDGWGAVLKLGHQPESPGTVQVTTIKTETEAGVIFEP